MLINPKIDDSGNLEISLAVPAFVFKRFILRSKNLLREQKWECLIENTNLIFIDLDKLLGITKMPLLKYENNYYFFMENSYDFFEKILEEESVIFRRLNTELVDEKYHLANYFSIVKPFDVNELVIN